MCNDSKHFDSAEGGGGPDSGFGASDMDTLPRNTQPYFSLMKRFIDSEFKRISLELGVEYAGPSWEYWGGVVPDEDYSEYPEYMRPVGGFWC